MRRIVTFFSVVALLMVSMVVGISAQDATPPGDEMAFPDSFELAPGVYHFSFQLSDGSWFLPDSVRNRVEDGFGGVNGVLVVVAS